MSLDLSVTAWTIITFIVLMLFLNRFFFRPLKAFMRDRQARIEKGEIELYITFDFLALEHKKNMTNLNLQITVPTDGAASSAYASVINKYAPHPYAAALAREYIFSDAGQINLARGFARPIRVDQITLPEDVAANLLPSEMYTGAFTIKDNDAWSKTVAQMGQLWQEEVLAYLQ